MNTITDRMLHAIESRVTINEHYIMSNEPITDLNAYYELYVMPKLDFVTVFSIRMWVDASQGNTRFQVTHGDFAYPPVTIEYASPGHAWGELMDQLTECFSTD